MLVQIAFLGQLALWRDQLRYNLGWIKQAPPEKKAYRSWFLFWMTWNILTCAPDRTRESSP